MPPRRRRNPPTPSFPRQAAGSWNLCCIQGYYSTRLAILETAAEITLFVALAGSAIVAGGQLFCLLAVVPAFPDWPKEFGPAVHQHALSIRPHRYLRVVALIVLVTGLATVLIERSTDTPVVLAGIAWALALVSSLISSREWPINHEIDSWEDSRSEEQMRRWEILRKKWDDRHLVRTIISLASLACFAAAAAFY